MDETKPLKDEKMNNFASRYPHHPGFKARDTSRDAADGIAAKAPGLRQRVLDEVRRQPGTPEEISARLGEPLLSCRPRFTELSISGLIGDSGIRRPSQGGRMAIVWVALEK
jgi:hypothetical protein